MNAFQRPFAYRSWNVTLILIALNVVVFTAQQLFSPVTYLLSLSPLYVLKSHFYWQFFTYMFVHGGLTHLLFNMLALYMFGVQVERRVGSAEFLLYYLLTGVLAGVFSFFVYYLTGQYLTFLMGASGALFAVQLAYASLFPSAFIYLFGLFPMRAPVMVLVFTGAELLAAITGSRSGVAHLTHLAGFGFGWLYFLLRFRYNPAKSFRRF